MYNVQGNVIQNGLEKRYKNIPFKNVYVLELTPMVYNCPQCSRVSRHFCKQCTSITVISILKPYQRTVKYSLFLREKGIIEIVCHLVDLIFFLKSHPKFQCILAGCLNLFCPKEL